MDDLRIWFIETRIRQLWTGISDKSWSDFLVEDGGKNQKALKTFLDAPAKDKVLYLTRSSSVVEVQVDDGFDLETSSDVEESIQTRTELITVVRICINTDIPTGLHPHNMDMVIIYKLRPVKIPYPATKTDGRKEMYRYLDILLIDQDPALVLAAHLKPTGGKYERELLNLMKKISICHTTNNKFQIPNIPELFKDSLAELPKFETLQSVGALEYPKHQIQFWRKRETELETLIDEFNFPAYNRSLKLLKQGNVSEVTALTNEMTKTYDLLKEAKDHVRFLGTIEESLELIATTENFSKLIEIIPGVAVSLRNIWLLSKYFNTDKKIHDLILMISRNVD